jgi:hypothetical protein
LMALDRGILPRPVRLRQKAWFFARGSATCGGAQYLCLATSG